jgi:hypothetical protein
MSHIRARTPTISGHPIPERQRFAEAAARDWVSFNWSTGSGQTFGCFAHGSVADGALQSSLAGSSTDTKARQLSRKNYSLSARTPYPCRVPLSAPSHSMTSVVITIGTRTRASRSASLRVADWSCEQGDRRCRGAQSH